MPAGATTATDLLAKMMKNTALPWDAITNIYLSAHTADPTVSGNQTTNEATFGSYARVAIVRSGVGWAGTNPLSNAALAQFPKRTNAGTDTITHLVLGTLVSGAGQILAVGELNDPIDVSLNIQMQFAIGDLTLLMT